VPRLVSKLQVLIQKVGRKKVEEWEVMVAEARWDDFVEDILVNHYDSAYADAAKRSGRDDANAEFLMLPDTEDATYAAAAAELISKYDVHKPPTVRDIAMGGEGAGEGARRLGAKAGAGEGQEAAAPRLGAGVLS
jgi:tRNA 2-selenouridine synthase